MRTCERSTSITRTSARAYSGYRKEFTPYKRWPIRGEPVNLYSPIPAERSLTVASSYGAGLLRLTENTVNRSSAHWALALCHAAT
jgi:hypothetical protein